MVPAAGKRARKVAHEGGTWSAQASPGAPAVERSCTPLPCATWHACVQHHKPVMGNPPQQPGLTAPWMLPACWLQARQAEPA